MIAGGHPEEPAPFLSPFRSGPVAVHGAVQDYCRSRLVSLRDCFHEGVVLYATKTFVVYDHVITLSPVLLGIDADLVVPGRAALVHDCPIHLRALTDATGNDYLLAVIVVAATTRDEQCPEGLFATISRFAPGRIAFSLIRRTHGHPEDSQQRERKKGSQQAGISRFHGSLS